MVGYVGQTMMGGEFELAAMPAACGV